MQEFFIKNQVEYKILLLPDQKLTLFYLGQKKHDILFSTWFVLFS